MQQCDKLFNKPLLSFLEKKNHNSLFCWKYDDIKTVPVKFLKKIIKKNLFLSRFGAFLGSQLYFSILV